MSLSRAVRRGTRVAIIVVLDAPLTAAINFGSPSFVTTGLGPSSITVADFNGDGHTDFATAKTQRPRLQLTYTRAVDLLSLGPGVRHDSMSCGP